MHVGHFQKFFIKCKIFTKIPYFILISCMINICNNVSSVALNNTLSEIKKKCVWKFLIFSDKQRNHTSQLSSN